MYTEHHIRYADTILARVIVHVHCTYHLGLHKYDGTDSAILQEATDRKNLYFLSLFTSSIICNIVIRTS